MQIFFAYKQILNDDSLDEEQTMVKPVIFYDFQINKFYALILINSVNLKPVQWIVINKSAKYVGDEIMNYQNLKKSNNYCAILYLQRGYIDNMELFIREKFDINYFAKTYDLLFLDMISFNIR